MILVLGGTSEAERIVEELEERGLAYILSVATDYGKIVAENYSSHVIQGRLTKEELGELIERENVQLIIDGTHPFAELVSTNAMEAAVTKSIDYLRYERASLNTFPEVTYVSSINEACEVALLKQTGSIYLTVGSKTIEDYLNFLPKERLKVRVLPVSSVIEKLEAIGLNSDHIEGIRGPFSKELNVALLKQANANSLITKDSGLSGGIMEKIAACVELGIPCIVIKRPILIYPNQVKTIEALANWLERVRA